MPPVPPPHNKPPASSDISMSTASTLMVVLTQWKSVCVLLQPTFSPTPPVLDDNNMHVPWSGGEVWGKKLAVVVVRVNAEHDICRDDGSLDCEP